MRPHRLYGPLAVLSTVVALACGGGAPEGESAADMAQYEGPIAATADATAGEASFKKLCNGCHPGAQKGIGPQLAGDPHSPAKIRMTVREGDDKMPPFGADKLSDADLENVLAYLATMDAVSP